jgi:outer membrane protein assembly factor BamB
MRRHWSLIAAAGLAGLSLAARAADWPQWRGPQRTGISAETGLLKEWPAEGPKLLWHAKEIGFGYSTPAVVGERVYLLSNDGPDNEYVQALSARDGKQVWSTRVGGVGNPDQNPSYPGARSTPTVDGPRLYALGSDGDLVCVESATGRLLWKKSLRAEFGGQPGIWAYSESPLVDGDVVVCTPGGAQATLLALNKLTGEVIWKSPVPGADQAAYASIVPMEVGGRKQYVQFLQNGVVGVDAKSGKFLWRYDATAKGSPANIPTPIVHNGAIFTSTALGGGGLVRLKANGDAVTAEPVYFDKKLLTGLGGAVRVGDYLYATGGTAMMCIDFATGQIKWQERGIGTSSLAYADGRLYAHGENTGQVALVDATPEAYREKGRFTPPDMPEHGRSKAWAHPVIANGRLYIRDLGSLWCYDITAR